jgi:hypothetical protein
MKNNTQLYKDYIDVLNTLICCIKVSDSIKKYTDSRGKRSKSMTSKGTVWEKTITLRYNKVPSSKIGNLNEWVGAFRNGIYTLTKKTKGGEDYAVSIPISELDRIYREEQIQEQMEKQARKMTSPYSSVGMNEIQNTNINYSTVDQSLTKPKQDLYQSVRNLSMLITSIAGVIGALETMKGSVFAAPIKKIIELLGNVFKGLKSAEKGLNQAGKQINNVA